jgi:hypothetical protein
MEPVHALEASSDDVAVGGRLVRTFTRPCTGPGGLGDHQRQLMRP